MTQNQPTVILIDAFPDWLADKGIFSEMEDLPWAEDISADLLDMDYFGNHSGWKKCSPLLYKLFNTDYELSDANRKKLADLVTSKFLPNWTALWNTYHFTYNPITDYDVTEVGEREGASQRSKGVEREKSRGDVTSSSMTHGHVVTEDGTTTIDDDTSLTHGERVEVRGTSSVDEETSRWGFNSSEAVPVDKREASGSTSDTTIHSGTDRTVKDGEVGEDKTTTHSGIDSTAGSLTSSEDESAAEAEAQYDTDEYTKRFSGLKGDTPVQDLIAKERELWKDSYFDKVYADVDSVLASLIYKREHRINPYALFPFGYYAT